MSDARRLGWFAVIADVAITAILTAFLLIATDGQLDAVPRPIALLALYASPGVIGAIGVAVELGLLAAAILFAGWRARLSAGLGRRPAP